MSDKFYDALIDYKRLPDKEILYDAACGLDYGINEAIRRGIYDNSAKVTKSLEDALADVKLEWIEE
jgi:hypothetical protein